MTMLEAESVSYRAGAATLVDGVSLALARGEVLALVGPHDAGKSTLLRLLAGDLAPAEGRVLLDGRPLSSYRPGDLARLRSVMPQQTVLQFAFSAREVVMMGRAPRLRGGETAADWAVVEACLARTDSLALAERSYLTLSGGEQQRVTLARVLAQETPILLLDEPTASLDLRHQELVMGVAREAAAGGAAVLAVLHDLNLAAAHADRVAVLSRGRLAALGPPREVFTEGLLGEVFEYPVVVLPHPLGDYPLIVPRGTQASILDVSVLS
jgi:iron complex transport system ATP-binding protein